MAEAQIISRNVVINPEGEEVVVCVRQLGERYEVFINGGLLSEGEDCFRTYNLRVAFARAGQEAATAALGG